MRKETIQQLAAEIMGLLIDEIQKANETIQDTAKEPTVVPEEVKEEEVKPTTKPKTTRKAKTPKVEKVEVVVQPPLEIEETPPEVEEAIADLIEEDEEPKTESKPKITLDEIKATMTSIMQEDKDGGRKLKAILSEFKVKSASMLKSEDYDAYFEKINALRFSAEPDDDIL